MAYTFENYPGYGTTHDTADELLLAVLNKNASGKVSAAETELTLEGTVYTDDKVILPKAGNSYLQFDAAFDHAVRITTMSFEFEGTTFLPQLRILFFRGVPPVQVDNTDIALTYAQSGTLICDIVTDVPVIRDGIGYVQFTDWIDLKCDAANNKIYFIVITLNGGTSTVDKKLRIKATGIITDG